MKKMSKIDLYNGDCLEVMDNLIEQGVKVDAIITDPPYGMNFRSNYRKIKYDKIENDNNLDWLPSFVKKSYDILNDNTHAYFFCSFHNVDIFKQELEKLFTVKNILIWEKNNTGMGDLEGDYAPKYEMIIYVNKGRRLLNGERDSNIIKHAKTHNEHHPTEKPVGLIGYLINKSTKCGEIVLDPFMGGGTTGVSCCKLDRNFIGIELIEKYFNTSKKRIQEEQNQLF